MLISGSQLKVETCMAYHPRFTTWRYTLPHGNTSRCLKILTFPHNFARNTPAVWPRLPWPFQILILVVWRWQQSHRARRTRGWRSQVARRSAPRGVEEHQERFHPVTKQCRLSQFNSILPAHRECLRRPSAEICNLLWTTCFLCQVRLVSWTPIWCCLGWGE